MRQVRRPVRAATRNIAVLHVLIHYTRVVPRIYNTIRNNMIKVTVTGDQLDMIIVSETEGECVFTWQDAEFIHACHTGVMTAASYRLPYDSRVLKIGRDHASTRGHTRVVEYLDRLHPDLAIYR